jgi:hypothetical protein
MTSKDLRSIISEVNSRAKTHPIGMLQEIRKELKGLKHLPTQNVFTSLTTFKERFSLPIEYEQIVVARKR